MEFGESGLLNIPSCCLKQDDLTLKATQEFSFVLRRRVSVIDRFQLAVGGNLLYQKRKVGNPLFRIPQAFPGAGGCGGNGVAPLHRFLISADTVLGEQIHGDGYLFQNLNSLQPLVSGALLGLYIVLNVNEQSDFSAALPGLAGRPEASGNAGDNGFFRVIGAQSFEPGEPFLVRHLGGDILSPLDFVPFPLKPNKQIVQAGEHRD